MLVVAQVDINVYMRVFMCGDFDVHLWREWIITYACSCMSVRQCACTCICVRNVEFCAASGAVHVCVYLRMHVCLRLHTYHFSHIRTDIYIFVCVYTLPVYAYTCMHTVCVYIYVYTHCTCIHLVTEFMYI
jgi:hypothetical protein